MYEIIVTVVAPPKEDEPSHTAVFRFEFDEEWDYKDMLREMSEHPKCLDAYKLRAKPENFRL